MKFTATTFIKQSPEKIWEIITDGSAFPEWDPHCDKIEGEIAFGNKIKAFTKLSPGRAFAVKVVEFETGKKMMWSGGMPFGLFKGERSFKLKQKEDGVEFTLSEEFSGPLLGLIGKSIPDMSDAFEDFVNGLKARAEAA